MSTGNLNAGFVFGPHARADLQTMLLARLELAIAAPASWEIEARGRFTRAAPARPLGVATVRAALIREKESFVFETVFSDPAGEKLAFLSDAADQGYTVVLCFIGLEHVELSEARVAQRVLRGGHDVPTEKLVARFPSTLHNLSRATRELPYILVYDNSERARPFRAVAELQQGALVTVNTPVPAWARGLFKEQ